jgi:hypothetical protein
LLHAPLLGRGKFPVHGSRQQMQQVVGHVG